jgi:hypothetical protein
MPSIRSPLCEAAAETALNPVFENFGCGKEFWGALDVTH